MCSLELFSPWAIYRFHVKLPRKSKAGGFPHADFMMESCSYQAGMEWNKHIAVEKNEELQDQPERIFRLAVAREPGVGSGDGSLLSIYGAEVIGYSKRKKSGLLLCLSKIKSKWFKD